MAVDNNVIFGFFGSQFEFSNNNRDYQRHYVKGNELNRKITDEIIPRFC